LAQFQPATHLHDIPNKGYRAALLYGSPDMRTKLHDIASALGCNVADGQWIAHDPNNPARMSKIDLLLIHLHSISERPSQELSNIASYLEESGARALIWTNMEELELAYAILPIYQCHFLVGTSDVEAMLIMSGAIQRGNMVQLHDNSLEREFSALHRMSD
jgi:hypothetical protein